MGKTNYPVGDFLIRIKNAALAHKHEVRVGETKLIKAVADVLVKTGHLDEVKKDGKYLVAHLAYRKKQPIVINIRLVSKPGLRVYINLDDLNGRKAPSVLIISTPHGVLSSIDAIKKRTGGEVIAEVL